MIVCSRAIEPKDPAPEPILEGQAWDRFDALGRPSPNGRYLRIPVIQRTITNDRNLPFWGVRFAPSDTWPRSFAGFQNRVHERAARVTREYRATNVTGLSLVRCSPLSSTTWYHKRHDAQVVAGKPSGLGQRFAAQGRRQNNRRHDERLDLGLAQFSFSVR